MYYKKIQVGDNIMVEFHSNWLGEETVAVNGQVVSRKSSITGTDHVFNVVEQGAVSRYILSSKLNVYGEAFLDLRKNHKLIASDIPLSMSGFEARSSKPKSEDGFSLPPLINTNKISGLKKLKEYHTEEALEELNKALEKNKKDPEIYFHLACAYSILEKPLEGFECLRKAVELGLNNTDSIMTHEMLAFLRIHPAFEAFVHSGWKEYDKDKMV